MLTGKSGPGQLIAGLWVVLQLSDLGAQGEVAG